MAQAKSRVMIRGMIEGALESYAIAAGIAADTTERFFMPAAVLFGVYEGLKAGRDVEIEVEDNFLDVFIKGNVSLFRLSSIIGKTREVINSLRDNDEDKLDEYAENIKEFLKYIFLGGCVAEILRFGFNPVRVFGHMVGTASTAINLPIFSVLTSELTLTFVVGCRYAYKSFDCIKRIGDRAYEVYRREQQIEAKIQENIFRGLNLTARGLGTTGMG